MTTTNIFNHTSLTINDLDIVNEYDTISQILQEMKNIAEVSRLDNNNDGDENKVVISYDCDIHDFIITINDCERFIFRHRVRTILEVICCDRCGDVSLSKDCYTNVYGDNEEYDEYFTRMKSIKDSQDVNLDCMFGFRDDDIIEYDDFSQNYDNLCYDCFAYINTPLLKNTINLTLNRTSLNSDVISYIWEFLGDDCISSLYNGDEIEDIFDNDNRLFSIDTKNTFLISLISDTD